MPWPYRGQCRDALRIVARGEKGIMLEVVNWTIFDLGAGLISDFRMTAHQYRRLQNPGLDGKWP